MRRRVLLVAGAMSALLVGAVSCTNSGTSTDSTRAVVASLSESGGDTPELALMPGVVNVNATCSPTTINLVIAPRRLEVRATDTVTFRLNASANTDSLWVESSRAATGWALEDPLPYRIGKGQEKASKVRAGAPQNTPFKYVVKMACSSGTGADTIVVDPEVIIVSGQRTGGTQ